MQKIDNKSFNAADHLGNLRDRPARVFGGNNGKQYFFIVSIVRIVHQLFFFEIYLEKYIPFSSLFKLQFNPLTERYSSRSSSNWSVVS